MADSIDIGLADGAVAGVANDTKIADDNVIAKVADKLIIMNSRWVLLKYLIVLLL